jgi:hypothetical protein
VQWAKSQLGQGTGTSAAAATYTPSMFYGSTSVAPGTNAEGGYVGPTVNYPAYKDPILAEQEASAAINAKYGIGGVGSISQTPSVDTTQAAADMQSMKSTLTDIQGNADVTIKANVTEARKTFTDFVAEINATRAVVSVDIRFLMNVSSIQAYIIDQVNQAIAGL